MNPYINSLNGWGGGFIAFWPSVGVVVPAFTGYFRRGLFVRLGGYR